MTSHTRSDHVTSALRRHVDAFQELVRAIERLPLDQTPPTLRQATSTLSDVVTTMADYLFDQDPQAWDRAKFDLAVHLDRLADPSEGGSKT